MRDFRRRIVPPFAALLLILAAACSTEHPSGAGAPPGTPSGRYFDLVAEYDPTRAELGRRSDFGWAGCVALDSGFDTEASGPGALILDEGVLHFDCPWGTGPFTIELTLRANRPCTVTVTLNDRELGRPRLKRSATTHSWEVDGTVLRPEGNRLVITVPEGPRVRLIVLVLPIDQTSVVDGKRRVSALPAMPPTRISYDCRPAAGDRLIFDTFFRRPPARHPEGLIHFEVTAVAPPRKETIFSRTVKVGVAEPPVHTEPAEVDLTPLAGRDVRLVFGTRFEGETHWPMAGEAFWARPRISPAVTRAGTPLIIWLVDTMRADHLGCYGYERDTSPNFDALAEEGLRFARLTAQSSWTKPSIATILTGLHPSAHGAVGREDGMGPGVTTMAQVLRDQGYTTAAFSANGNFYAERLGLARGFDEVWGYWVPRTDEKWMTMTEELVRDVFAWVERHAGEPVFLFVHTVEPHDPYAPPAPWDTKYAGEYSGPFASSATVPALRETAAQGLPDFPRHLRQAVDLYDGEIAYNDHLFGQFVERLKAAGLYEDAVLVVVSDHGEEFNDHDEWGHGRTLFGEQVNLPLIVRLPGGRLAGTVVEHRVRQVDLMPSLLEWLGLPLPETQGASFARAVEAGEAPPVVEVLAEESLDGHVLYSVIEGRYKYILRTAPYRRERLYDLEDDPRERQDIIDEHPGLARRLSVRVDSFRRESEAALEAQRDERGPVRLSDEEIANLKALGYLQ